MRLAWPIGVSMLSFTLKGFVDMLMVGQLGTDALGAVGFASIATWFAVTFPWGILRGQRPLISQHIGAGEHEKAFSFGVHAFALAFFCGSLLLIFAGPIAEIFRNFITTTELGGDAVEIGTSYFHIRLQWLLPTLLTFAIAEYLRSTGSMRIPMVVDLLVHPLNILFNWVLIFGHFGLPAMGADGAALGTGLADLIALGVIVYVVKPGNKLNRKTLVLSWERMRKVFIYGITGGIQFTLENLSFLSITWIVGQTNAVALAVHQAGIQLVHLSLLPAVAVADAGSVLIGKFVGELDWEGAKRTVRSILQILVPFMSCMAVVYLIFGRGLAGVFLHNDDPVALENALDLGKGVMAACAFWQLGDALQITFRFCLRAAGDHIWVMWTGILCTWLLSIPLCWWVVFVYEGDVAMVWCMWGAEIFAGGFIFLWRWKSGAWMKKRVVDDGAELDDAPFHSIEP